MVKFKIKMNVISEENAVLGNGDDDGSKSPIQEATYMCEEIVFLAGGGDFKECLNFTLKS